MIKRWRERRRLHARIAAADFARRTWERLARLTNAEQDWATAREYAYRLVDLENRRLLGLPPI